MDIIRSEEFIGKISKSKGLENGGSGRSVIVLGNRCGQRRQQETRDDNTYLVGTLPEVLHHQPTKNVARLDTSDPTTLSCTLFLEFVVF